MNFDFFSWFCCYNNGQQNRPEPQNSEELQRLTNEDISSPKNGQKSQKQVIKVQPKSTEINHFVDEKNRQIGENGAGGGENDRIFLCCSDRKLKDDQVDCCPKFWFREFTKKSSKNNSNSQNCRRRFQTVIWRLCFLGKKSLRKFRENGFHLDYYVKSILWDFTKKSATVCKSAIKRDHGF